MGIMCFKYTDNYECYIEVMKTPLASCLCKHVLNDESSKAKAVKKESLNIGYTQVQWGSGEKFELTENRIMQLGQISRIIYKKAERPIRIVIDQHGEIWADNLHHTVAYIITKGFDVMIGEVPVYIIDMRNTNEPVIVDKDESVSKNLNNILGSIDVAAKRCRRVSEKIIDVHYTVEEFMNDNKLDCTKFPFLTKWSYVSKDKLELSRQ